MKFNPSLLVFLTSALVIDSKCYSRDESPILQGSYFGQNPPGSKPEVFAPGIVSVEGRYEFCVSFSPELNEMYFSASDEKGISSVYYSKLENNVWSNPKEANFTKGRVRDEFSGFVSPDGKRIYFSTYDPTAPLKIWYVNRYANSWSNAVQLDSPINRDEVVSPKPDKDGNLYFSIAMTRKAGIPIYIG